MDDVLATFIIVGFAIIVLFVPAMVVLILKDTKQKYTEVDLSDDENKKLLEKIRIETIKMKRG